MQGWKMKSLGRRLGMECDCGVIQLSLLHNLLGASLGKVSRMSG